jgi:hypothetical protein
MQIGTVAVNPLAGRRPGNGLELGPFPPVRPEPAMALYRDALPQLDADVFLTDGGLETTLIFDDGIDLPDFAAFVLRADSAGRDALVRYFDS